MKVKHVVMALGGILVGGFVVRRYARGPADAAMSALRVPESARLLVLGVPGTPADDARRRVIALQQQAQTRTAQFANLQAAPQRMSVMQATAPAAYIPTRAEIEEMSRKADLSALADAGLLKLKF